MSETNENVELEDALEPAPTGSAARSSGFGTTVLTVALALMAIGIGSLGVYLAYQQAQQQAALLDRVKTLEESVSRRDDTLLPRLMALERLQAAQEEHSLAIRQMMDEKLEAMAGEIRRRRGTNSQDWRYAEVEYLLRLANQRLLMERDAAAAVAFFQAADEILATSEGTLGFELRRAIANDIANMQSVEGLDLEGWFVRIGSAARQVPLLRQRKLEYEAPEGVPSEPAPESSGASGFFDLLAGAGERLAGLVDFRRGDIRVTPILPPREQYYLRQNLLMKLEQAQIALLRGNQRIYDAALAEAQVWVRQYFDLKDAATRTVLDTLSEAGSLNVSPQFPEARESLKLVRDRLARLHEHGSQDAVEQDQVP